MAERARPRLLRLGRDVGPVAPLVLGVLIAWSWDGGGFSVGTWAIAGIGLVALLALTLFSDPTVRLVTGEGSRTVMLSALWAFVAWNFASMLWADFPGEAWTGSNKTLLYATIFTILGLWAWRGDAAMALLALFVLGVTAVAAIVLVQATTATDTARFFQEGRLLPPIGYVNANPALWMIAFWPAAFIGSVRSVPIVARALALGCATLLLSVSLLGESRGWLFVLPVTSLLAVALARQRLRLVLGIALPSAGALAVLRPMVDVYVASEDGRPLGPPLDRAAVVTLVATLVVAAAGIVWAVLDRRVRLAASVHRLAGLAVVLVAVAALTGAAAVLGNSIRDDPRGWLDRNWSDFTRGYSIDKGGSRFVGSLGTDRYLQWKVALIQFKDAPVLGKGSDNYAFDYTLRRETDYVDPRFPHSTPLRLLGQLGLVGAGFFAVFAGFAVFLALRRRRALGPEVGGVAGICLAMFGYWFVHSSIDWFWEIPALAASAFAFLALGASLEPESEVVPPRPERRRPRPNRVLVAALVPAAIVVCSLGLQWLSFRYEIAGLAIRSTSTAEAYERLDRAARLNPLSAEPRVIAGSIALQENDRTRARREFEDAIDREPKNWYPYFQLALLEAVQQNYDEALRLVRTAQALNPADTIMRAAAATMRRHGRIDPAKINALYLKELNRRLSGNPRL